MIVQSWCERTAIDELCGGCQRSCKMVLRRLDIGNELHTPDFLLIEFDSIVCKRIRREKISEEEGE